MPTIVGSPWAVAEGARLPPQDPTTDATRALQYPAWRASHVRPRATPRTPLLPHCYHRGFWLAPGAEQSAYLSRCARSSTGQSSGLLIRRLQVRVLPGALPNPAYRSQIRASVKVADDRSGANLHQLYISCSRKPRLARLPRRRLCRRSGASRYPSSELSTSAREATVPSSGARRARIAPWRTCAAARGT